MCIEMLIRDRKSTLSRGHILRLAIDLFVRPGSPKVPPVTQNALRKSSGTKNKEVRRGTKCKFLFQGKISALNRLNSQINVSTFMYKML